MSDMWAMVLDRQGEALVHRRIAVPVPGPGQVLIAVRACGVCRTDLHVVDGDLREPRLPLVPGHEIVGTVVETGEGVADLAVGVRVGVPWLGWTCRTCRYCRGDQENLCEQALFTGYQLNGGYAEYTVADQRYCLPLPAKFDDITAAPLLCAGLIGHRALGMAGGAEKVGLYGFGAAAHIIAQVACHQGREVYAFVRPGDTEAMVFARRLGAIWAGPSTEPAPDLLDAAIIFAPVGRLVPAALAAIRPGGVVVCAGIHMSDIPSFAYELLWREKTIQSVANLSRADGLAFLDLAAVVPLKIATEALPLAQANEALARLKQGRLEGAAVLTIAA